MGASRTTATAFAAVADDPTAAAIMFVFALHYLLYF
jgi:hypothetical protein